MHTLLSQKYIGKNDSTAIYYAKVSIFFQIRVFGPISHLVHFSVEK